MSQRIPLLLLLGLIFSFHTRHLIAQDKPEKPEKPSKPPAAAVPTAEDVSSAPVKVDVNPQARDEEIGHRLQSVLVATEWFTDPKVRVEKGVVFLTGEASTEELKKWAGDLARNTQDVVAVANRMTIARPPLWDFTPAATGVVSLWRDTIRTVPLFAFGLVVQILFLGAAILTARMARFFLRGRIRTRLLLNVIARSLGVAVFFAGFYINLRVAGLTQLALSVVGGTGLVGLAVGIAFRDITENFLASIFLSMQRPFETGDLVEVAGITGYVQQLNIRTTILMTLDGNVVQIPNATVYKSNLRNFTTNANRREEFTVGIGYDNAISDVQEIARQVLAEHPAVLKDPEPLVLAESMGSATINLRIYFWLNGREHSSMKVRSSVIRLIKIAFQKNEVSLPDEAREIVFPQGIPVTLTGRTLEHAETAAPLSPAEQEVPTDEVSSVSTKAESGLSSEAGVIEEQARQAKPMKEEENLLHAPASSSPEEEDAPAAKSSGA